MRRFLSAVIAILVLWLSTSSFAMSRPTCNDVASPASGHEKIKIVESSLNLLSGVAPDEARAAIIASMHRWNQQSESGVQFSYNGTASGPVRARKGCGRSCNGLNTVNVQAECESASAYFQRRCRGDKLCVPNNTYHQWRVVLCSSYYTEDDPNNIKSINWGTGDVVSPKYDMLSTMIHELGHAQGLGHPGAHLVNDSNQFPEAYCDGDAAAMGAASCADTHHMFRRDLYRYDQICAEERNGLRKRKVHHVQEHNDMYDYTVNTVAGGASNVHAWQAAGVHRVEVQQGVNRTWRNLLSLAHVYWTYIEDDLYRSRQVNSNGLPTSSANIVKMSLENFGVNMDWYQGTNAASFHVGDDEWKKVTQCQSSACSELKSIESVYPIELVESPSGNEVYGMWVNADRKTRTNAYRVNIAQRRNSGGSEQFKTNLLQPNLRSAVKPTLACRGDGLCVLYYVPVEDKRSRIHIQLLAKDSSGQFTKFWNADAAPLVYNDVDVVTGSGLVSWVRRTANNRANVYLAFASNEVGFPVKVLKVPLGAFSTTEGWSFGTAFSGLSVSRFQPGGAIDLVWVGP